MSRLKGGQGRTEEDIYNGGVVMLWLLVAAVVFTALLAVLVGGPR